MGGDDSVNLAGDTGSGVVTIGDQNTTTQGDNSGTIQIGDGNADTDVTGDDNQVIAGDGNATFTGIGGGSAVGTSNLLGEATTDQTLSDNFIGGAVTAGLISNLSIADNSGIITTMMNTGSQVNMSNATVVNVYMTP